MSLIDKAERKLGRNFGIPDLMIYITATMLAVYILDLVLPQSLSAWLVFDRSLILQGQIWRVISFIVIPPSSSLLFILFTLAAYYLIGKSLESEWGVCKFTLYYICGILGTVISGFISGFATNVFLNFSLLFAFAYIFPNFEFRIYFAIPIKVKYIAAVNVLFFIFSFLVGSFSSKLSILFALANFFLFFGKDIFITVKNRIAAIKRRKKFEADIRRNRDNWN